MYQSNLRQRCFLLMIFAALFLPTIASAHQMSTGYLNLQLDAQQSNKLAGEIQIRWFDLQRALNIDNNGDGQLQWSEASSQQIPISEYVLQHLALSTAGQACPLILANKMKSDNHFDEGYLAFEFSSLCPKMINESGIRVSYSALFELDPDHKLIISMQGLGGEGEASSGVIDSEQQSRWFDVQQSGGFSTFSSFVYQGIVHILIGTDHILFIIVLLLTCTLFRANQNWQAKSSFIDIAKSAAWIVTAFTLAHSITLTATALGWIAPSSKWVELGIALSVLFTALNNIWPIVVRLGWITFAFGLMHGMGFASVLGELGLAKDHQLLSIVSFNLGVELGQLAILAFVIPILFLVRHKRWYQSYGVNLGSFFIAVVAVGWCIERV